MTTQTLVPTSTRQPSGSIAGLTLVGGATFHAVLADASDATYVDAANDRCSTSRGVIVGLGNMAALPTGAVIQAVRVVHRVKDLSTGTKDTLVRGRPYLSNYIGAGVVNAGSEDVFTDYAGPWETTRPQGGAWTVADVDALEVLLTSCTAGGGGRTHTAYLAVEVLVNERPVVGALVLDAPADNTRPEVSWPNLSDPDDDPQESYEVRFYATTSAGAVIDPDNPGAAVLAWSSGQVLNSGVRSREVGDGGPKATGSPDELAPGYYRAYVRVWQPKVAGQVVASTWANSAIFVIDVSAPAQPTLLAQQESSQGRIRIDVQANENVLEYEASTGEGAAPSGWAARTNGQAPATTVTVGAVYNGNQSLALTPTAAGDATWRTSVRRPVVGGDAYVARARLKSSGTVRQVALGVAWYDAANAFISRSTSPNLGTDAPWSAAKDHAAFTYNVVAPANAVTAEEEVTWRGMNEVHYADELSIQPSTSLAWARGGLLDDADYHLVLEYSDDLGVTWHTHPASPTVDVDVAQRAIVYDYEPQPHVARRYRVRATTADVTSAWSSSSTATFAPTKVWVKDPLHPERNVTVVPITLELGNLEPQGVYHPIGRRTAVVVSEGVRGVEGEVAFQVDGRAARLALEALVLSGNTLLVQDVLVGRQWFLKLGERHAWERLRAQPAAGDVSPVRDLHIYSNSAVEVERPAS